MGKVNGVSYDVEGCDFSGDASMADVASTIQTQLQADISANLTCTWVKRNNRWMHSLEDVAEWLVGTGKNMPHEVAEKRDDWDQVQKAVSTLPLPQRVVIVLYYLNDLSLGEISDILEVPEGTIKSRLYYGRLALKKSLGLALYGEGEKLPELNYERS